MTQCTNIKNEEEWDLQKKYVIGLDYGTLSGRAVVVDCENGEVLSSSVKNSLTKNANIFYHRFRETTIIVFHKQREK